MSTLQELFSEELRDLYDAEKQLVKALPKMSKAAHHPELKKVFADHLAVTKGQVERLEKVFGLIEEKPRSKPCHGMKGLVEEGREVMTEHAGEPILDPAMIGAAQRVEHYEMAGYMSARTLAEVLGLSKAVQLLDRTLREEQQADQKLSRLATKILKNGMRASAPTTNGAKTKRGGASPKSTRGTISTTDHDEIRSWAQERQAEPACVKGTGKRGDSGVLRLDFPGYSGAETLEHISWEEFFEKFDANGLALVYQEKTAGGKRSNFNKLVAR